MSVVDEVKQRLDIVEFIGSYVPLQKAGRNYKGLCPFHTEKTPSFIVFPETERWHCFGACSTGGDIFTFVMRQENMDFAQALRFLAERAGVELRPLDQAAMQRKDELDRLRAANAIAAQCYYHILMETPQGKPALRYLTDRGVTRESLAAFQLGYAPDEWHTLEHHLAQANVSPQDMLAAGLTVRGETGNVYDRFRGRVIFPIRDPQGRVIGFGGRVLDDSLPKYLNTAQTPLFEKGSALYGIDLARRSIRESGTAIVVEGYMDVVVSHQCGVTNTVACLGTALTVSQIKMLKRTTKLLILAMDADAAGMHATERGVETAQHALEHKVVPVPTPQGLVRYEQQLDAEIRILVLPDGLDPDELILHDRPRWDRLVAEASPVAQYFMESVMRETDVSTARGKREAVSRLLPVIAAMDNPVERSHYLQRLARRVRVDERDLWPELNQLRRRPTRARSRSSGTRDEGTPGSSTREKAAGPASGLEERCVALLLESPALLPEVMEVAELGPESFRDVRNRQILEALGRFASAYADYDLEDFCAELDAELSAHVESLLQGLRAGPLLTPEMAREDLIKCSTRLRKAHLSELVRELRFVQQDAQEEGTEERVRELNEMIERLRKGYLEIDRRFHAATLVGRSKRELRVR